MTRSRLRNILLGPIYDTYYKKPSFGENLTVLDGIRGLAVVLVVASHCGFLHMEGQGGIGVWLFFSLSGFLLVIPYAQEPGRISRPADVANYFARRLLRIIPMYYSVIIFTYAWYKKDHAILREHLLFIRGNDVFWSVPQELIFYLFLPVVVYAVFRLFKKGSFLAVLFILVLAALARILLSRSVFRLAHGDTFLPLYVYVFLTGMACSYACQSEHFRARVFSRAGRLTMACVGSLVLLIFVISSKYFYYNYWAGLFPFITEPPNGWAYPGTFGILCSMLIIATLAGRRSPAALLANSVVFRLIGTVSYSMYLLHPFVIGYAQARIASPSLLFGVVVLATFVLSYLTYTLIERPFIRMKSPVSRAVSFAAARVSASSRCPPA